MGALARLRRQCAHNPQIPTLRGLAPFLARRAPAHRGTETYTGTGGAKGPTMAVMQAPPVKVVLPGWRLSKGVALAACTLACWTIAPLLLKDLTDDLDAHASNGWRMIIVNVAFLPLLALKARQGLVTWQVWRQAFIPSVCMLGGQVGSSAGSLRAPGTRRQSGCGRSPRLSAPSAPCDHRLYPRAPPS